jgi:hypothetical protein
LDAEPYTDLYPDSDPDGFAHSDEHVHLHADADVDAGGLLEPGDLGLP